ncbi:unnamed protein product, partial [Phaeothamnion confervicola]
GPIPLVQPQVPAQDNGCDCGVYVLAYAEHIATRWPALLCGDFNKNERSCALQKATAFINRKSFSPADVAARRVHFRGLLRRMQEERN